MSLAISVSYSQNRRDRLVSLRNGFTYVSNVTVLLLVFLLFQFIKDPKQQFAVLSYIITAIGLSLSIVYLIGVREVPLSAEAKRLSVSFDLMENDSTSKAQDEFRYGINEENSPSQLFPDIEEDNDHRSKREITHWS